MRKLILALTVVAALLTGGCSGGSDEAVEAIDTALIEATTAPTAAPTATPAATATPIPLLPQEPIAGSLDIEVMGVGFVDNLIEAIGWATNGQKILLPPRNIKLIEPITIISETLMHGDPSGDTVITAAPASTSVFAVLGDGDLTLTDVTIDASGTDVGILIGGTASATIERCIVDWAGTGLLAREEAALSVDKCKFRKGDTGVEVTDQASINVSDSDAVENMSAGFRLSSRGELSLANNKASSGAVGFEMNNASPTLQGNEALLNSTDGFQWRGISGGSATGNTSWVNDGAGFRMVGTASPDLTDNIATENDLGFSWQDSSSGEVTGNEATLNTTVGFTLRDGALPVLTANTAADNVEHGFFLFGSFSLGAERSLTNNIATGNDGAGFVLDASNPNANLVGNEATDNADAGFFFGANAGGDATGNSASGNRLDWLNNAPRVTASGNTCGDGSC